MFITEARDLPRSVAVLEIMRIPVRVAAGHGNEFPGSGKGSGVSGYAVYLSLISMFGSQDHFSNEFQNSVRVCPQGLCFGYICGNVLYQGTGACECSD